MAKFIPVTEDAKEPEVPKVKFKAVADSDGDFTITANGFTVAVFTSETGKLDLYANDDPQLAQAFSLDKNGYIKVCR